MIRPPDDHRRRNIRLQSYDYSQAGAYFVTICAYQRRCLFGKIVDDEMRLNEAGQTAERCWQTIPEYFSHVDLDAFVIMPNHVHGVLFIRDAFVVGANNHSPLSAHPHTTDSARGTSKTLGSIVRGFKIGVTKWFRANSDILDVWQRNYYEHIIRDEVSLSRCREYIVNNPLQWALDRENPDYVDTQEES
jgi:Transposase and inactivated derivatives